MQRILDYLLLTLGLALFVIGTILVIDRFVPVTLAAVPMSPQTESTSSRLPTTLAIPRLSIDLSIIPTTFPATTTYGVSYALDSDLPGTGTTVIYGHNWPRLLGQLSQVAVGDQILIYLSDNTVVRYRVDLVNIVSSHSDLVQAVGESRLIIYTCTGFLDSQRLVVYATSL